MTGINNISRNISALPQAAAKPSASGNFAPLVSSALNAIATTAVPSSTVCAVSKEGLGELSKITRDTYHALGTAANATASFVNRSIDTVEHAVNEGISDVKAAAHYVGEKLSDAEEAIEDGMSSVAHTVGKAVDTAENYVGHAVIAGVNAFNKIV